MHRPARHFFTLTVGHLALAALVTHSLVACGAQATEGIQMEKATLIQVTANPGQESELSDFLEAGRDLVEQTEPDTLYWFALRQEGTEDRFAIFDLFPDQSGRDAHFNGQVASALNQQAPTLIAGGWESGVLPNVKHFTTIAAKLPEVPVEVTKATVIVITAAPGKAAELEQFLIGGRDIVADTEPNTTYWFALKAETQSETFAVIDLFPHQQGRDEHFSGQVASALEANAPALVQGGWQDGVLENVVHFDVVAAR